MSRQNRHVCEQGKMHGALCRRSLIVGDKVFLFGRFFPLDDHPFAEFLRARIFSGLNRGRVRIDG